MGDFITALTADITSAQLWTVLTSTVDFLTIVVLFALGVYFIRRMVKGVSSGKARV